MTGMRRPLFADKISSWTEAAGTAKDRDHPSYPHMALAPFQRLRSAGIPLCMHHGGQIKP